MKILFIALFTISLSSYAQHSEIIRDIQANAITSNIYKESLTSNEKDFLSPKIIDKKFVYLGEADHYFEEKYAYRLKFIKYLLSQGYTHILDEMGVSDGEMVQSYLETGDEDYLKKVGLYGFKYGKPLKESTGNFVLSSKRYIRELRKLKAKYPKLIYGGYDLDMVPGTTYLQLDEFFIKYHYEFLEGLKEIIEQSKSLKANTQVMALTAAFNKFKEIRSKLQKNLPYKEFVHFELILRNFLRSVELREKFKSDYDFYELFTWREKQMFKNMIARSKLDPKEQKYILLGHNGHLTKTVDRYLDLDGIQQWYAIGSWVNDHYPKQVYAIWSLIGQGEHSGHGCPDRKTCYFTAPKTTLEYDLLTLDKENTLLFSTQYKSFTNAKNLIRTLVNGMEILEGPLALQADAVYFIPQVNDVKP